MIKFTFDGPNKLFIAKPGISYVNIKVDLYSDYKEEILIDDNSKWLEAIRVAGGDPLGGGASLDGYFFLKNGWKIRPQEADHILVLDGNLLLDEGETGDVVVPTLGSYNVMVRQKVSNIVNIVSTSGSDPSAIASAVWSDATGSYLSSSMAQISSSNEQVYNAIGTMSSSVDFMSGSVGFLSSSMVGVSSSNIEVYSAVTGMSSSIDYMSGSFSFLSSSMIDLSQSNTYVYDATLAMSSSVADVYTIVQDNEAKLDIAAVSSSLAADYALIAAASASCAYEKADTAAFSASLAVSASLGLQGQVLRLEKAEFGRWKIQNNQMIMYGPDGITPVATFDLLDEQGNPTSQNVYERKPV